MIMSVACHNWPPAGVKVFVALVWQDYMLRRITQILSTQTPTGPLKGPSLLTQQCPLPKDPYLITQLGLKTASTSAGMPLLNVP